MAEKWYEAGNEAHFKPVPEGYVFQSPNPWLFGRPRRYLINDEAQKAALLAHLGRWRFWLFFGFLIVLVLFMLLSTATSFSLSASLGLASPLLDGAIVGLVSAVPAQIYLHHGLRTLLQDAPLTDERITLQEQLPKILEKNGKFLFVGMLGGIGMIGLGMAILAFRESDRELLFIGWTLFALGGLSTIYHVYLLRLRSKSKHGAA
jgi:hypothetical protein